MSPVPHPEICDQCFAITGTLETMTRESAIRQIHEVGGSYSETVNGATTVLVKGMKPGKKKLHAAILSNVQMVDEEEFLTLVGAPHTKRLPGLLRRRGEEIL